MHMSVSVAGILPAAQRVHEDRPVAVAYLPAEHEVQALEVDAYFPAAHGVHAVNPEFAIDPDLHDVQTVAAAAAEYVPRAQLVHVARPFEAAYFPATQSVHVAALAALIRPTAQLVQDGAPTVE